MRTLALAAVTLLCSHAAAADMCRPTPPLCTPPFLALSELDARLSSQYGEAPVSIGLQSDGVLLQVYSSDVSGTWTMIAIKPDGCARLVAAGRGWQNTPTGPGA